MTGWMIFLCIAVFLALLLFSPAVLQVSYRNKKTVIRVSFLGIPLYRSDRQKTKEKKQKKKKAKKKSKKKKKSDADEKKKPKKTLSEWMTLLQNLMAGICKGLRRLTKGIRLRRVTIAICTGGFDADKCAVSYGKMNAVLYPFLSLLEQVFSVKYDYVGVHCGFGMPESRYVIDVTLKLSIAGVLSAVFAFALSFLWRTVKGMQKQEKPVAK